jgi:hypothetical protein
MTAPTPIENARASLPPPIEQPSLAVGAVPAAPVPAAPSEVVPPAAPALPEAGRP